MERVRSSVSCWAEFGDLLCGEVLHSGTEVLLTTGSRDLLLFTAQHKRVKTILQFDSPVTSFALSDDKSHLYALCQNDGLYCTTLSLESSSHSQTTQNCDDCIVSTVSRDSLVVEDRNLQSFILVEGIIVTVGLQESFWSFDFYEVPNCSTRAIDYRKRAGLQVPAVATTIPHTTEDARVCCIYPSKDSASKRCTHQHHFYLEPLLFRLLFGVDASLAHSPVVLCGLPDGRLFCFPPLLPSCGEQRPRIRMLHSLEQSVTFIGTSVTGEQGPQCLVVAGQMGRILLIRANKANSDGKAADYSFIEQTVRGPVVCACVDGENLYYSTSTHLLTVQLNSSATSPSSSLSAAKEKQPERRTLPFQSAVSLSVCRVIALAEPLITPTGCVQLLALCLSGRLLQVTVPQRTEKDSASKITSTQVGQTVKDLLAGIGNVWERASSLKHQLQVNNNVLKHLNQVINICNLLLNSQKKDQKGSDCKPPISCHGTAKWSTLLQKDTLVLTCSLENSSNSALEEGWTLCVEIESPHSLRAEGSSRTYSFALKKLDWGQKVDVSVPLDVGAELFLPVKIHCFLVFSLQSLLHSKESSGDPVSQHLADKGCISLALNTLTLDWIDSLRIGEPASHGVIPEQNTAWEATHFFLSSRRICMKEQPMPQSGPHVVAIQISSELLKTWLGFHDCSTAALCISVLRWLISGTSEAKGQNLVEGPVLCARGLDGQPVRLLTKEVILSDVNSEGPLSAVEVQMESSSMSAVCGLHHAVLRRVQGLLQDASVKSVSPAHLRGQYLCETIRHAESLYKDLQDSRASAAFGGVIKTRTSLFPLYLELRKHPLLIL
ncbi:Fanconi anemia core complex-associated protein 100 isoform X1 [Astyanax mexicanus]|uniref:Fanconi anemia core complex-associated protein 100 isoform X1 n=1 Tax=Astyanax mexicanus TaxID=7994 RepID=UPI0020CABCF2|nr:Fanconi anemia core complex-associated protein 100 isoform X1 [Astyanax mexicanus]